MDSNYEIVRELIEYNCDGVDKYIHNNSTWLIFTDDKKWVIELTKDGTLWYNYDFFKNVLKYLSLDVVENQHYITKWVEDTIQNGVKHTEYGDWLDGDERFDDIIQNGVKHTEKSLQIDGSCVVEDVIQNGVKETHDDVYHHKGRVGGVIKNGIKETKLIDYSDNTEFIVNGVISRGELVLNKTST